MPKVVVYDAGLYIYGIRQQTTRDLVLCNAITAISSLYGSSRVTGIDRYDRPSSLVFLLDPEIRLDLESGIWHTHPTAQCMSIPD